MGVVLALSLLIRRFSNEISGTRVLHLADIVAPKVKTPTTDEEVRSH